MKMINKDIADIPNGWFYTPRLIIKILIRTILN